MIKKDKLGRITKIDSGDKIQCGYSVCNSCGKDMPYFDVVCYKCNYTFCYDCVISHTGMWICFGCTRDKSIKSFTYINTFSGIMNHIDNIINRFI